MRTEIFICMKTVTFGTSPKNSRKKQNFWLKTSYNHAVAKVVTENDVTFQYIYEKFQNKLFRTLPPKGAISFRNKLIQDFLSRFLRKSQPHVRKSCRDYDCT